MLNRNAVDNHPVGTPLSGGLRFVAENIAWIAGPWSVASVSAWLVLPAVLILVGVPSVFSTPGDKKLIIVATPGPQRFLIELALHVVAVVAVWILLPSGFAVAATAVVVAAVLAGFPRTNWLLSGAPLPTEQGPPEP